MDFDGGSDKPRLTAEQKKRNHIESEKKRREAIRAGFERLSKIIPDCEGQARSESIVLQRTVVYLQGKLKEKDSLREQALKKGMSLAEFEKVYNDIEKAVKAGELKDVADKEIKEGEAGPSGRRN